jgi:hypothetical protein
MQGLPKEQCRSALQMVVEKSKDNATRRKAEGLLKRVQ